MRPKNRLRLCSLGMILAAVAVAADQAEGYGVYIDGDVYTASADNCIFLIGCVPWYQDVPIFDVGAAGIGDTLVSTGGISSHGTMEAAAGAVVFDDTFRLYSQAHGTGNDGYRGPTAYATVQIVVLDRITPSLAGGYPHGHTYTYVQHFNIDGEISGASVGPDPTSFSAEAGVDVVHNTQIVFSTREVRTNAGVLAGPMPRGDVWWTPEAVPGVPYDLRMRIYVGADGNGVEDMGTFTATSNFSHTFRWGEVTDVFDVTAGVPIPAEDFHLYGENGFDWAHPPSAVPEPCVLHLIVFAGVLVFFRRPVMEL